MNGIATRSPAAEATDCLHPESATSKTKQNGKYLRVWILRLSCEADLRDCTAEARRAQRKGVLDSEIFRPLRPPCLCGEYFFTENPERLK
jgi:hypothetical protein